MASYAQLQRQFRAKLGEECFTPQNVSTALLECGVNCSYQKLRTYAQNNGFVVTTDELGITGSTARYWIRGSKIQSILEGLNIEVQDESQFYTNLNGHRRKARD